MRSDSGENFGVWQRPTEGRGLLEEWVGQGRLHKGDDSKEAFERWPGNSP